MDPPKSHLNVGDSPTDTSMVNNDAVDGHEAGEKLRAEIKCKQRFKNRDRTYFSTGATSAT